MDAMTGWFIAGLALVGLSLTVGVFASVSGVKSARGPRERAFVRRACAASSGMVSLFVVAAFVLPVPYNWISAVLFLFAVPAAIYRWTTQRQLLRELEERERRSAEGVDESPQPGG